MLTDAVKASLRRGVALLGVTALAAVAAAAPALADGTETLGPPSVPLASGSNLLVAGVGTETTQPGTISFSVPGTVKQALLYWSGHYSFPNTGDDSVLVDGAPIQGTLIGGPSCFFALGGINPCDLGSTSSNVFATYRADVTTLVHTGTNALAVSGLDFHANDGGSGNASSTGPAWPDGNDGAGIAVIYDAGSTSAVAGLVDGQDLAYYAFPSPFDTTVPQTFSFTSASVDRPGAVLSTLASSVEGPASGFGDLRPNELQLTFDVGGSITLVNPWGSLSGAEFDALNSTITIPAGASKLTVQALSAGDGGRPASLNWIAAGLTVPNPPASPGTLTIGYWKNHADKWPVGSVTLGAGTISEANALTILGTPPRGDATIILAQQLIGAELNVALGNTSSCIASTITAANTLLATYPVGSGLKASSAAGTTAVSLAATLDQYNNGLLCVPHQ